MSKQEKVKALFGELDLNQKIAVHNELTNDLDKAIDEKDSELDAEKEALKKVKLTINGNH